jgi:hypothetical protein
MTANPDTTLPNTPMRDLTTPPEHNQEQGEVCIANISPSERRKRLRFGIIEFAVALTILAVLMITGVSHLWRLGLFVLFAAAATGYFQWHDKTCVALAAKGTRKTTDHDEKIEDASELAQVMRQSRRVMLKATLTGVLLTAMVVLMPF